MVEQKTTWKCKDCGWTTDIFVVAVLPHYPCEKNKKHNKYGGQFEKVK